MCPGLHRTHRESYRIEAAAEDLVLDRELPRKQTPPVHGKLQLTLDLERDRVSLHSFNSRPTVMAIRIARSTSPECWMISVTRAGRPRSHGDLDMRLLEPVTGYPDAPDGIAHLDLAAGGMAPAFQIAGSVHVDGGSYLARASTPLASTWMRASMPIAESC